MNHQLSIALLVPIYDRLMLGNLAEPSKEAKHVLIKDEQLECSSSAGASRSKAKVAISNDEPEKRSSLYFHFIESKDRLMFLVFSFLLTFSLAYIYSVELIFLYVKPFLIFEKPFIFTELTEALYITLKIAGIYTLYVMFPLVCYQIWCFFIPSCYIDERTRWSVLLLCSNILVLIGWLAIYEIVLPKLAGMLLQFEVKTQLLTIQLEARIDCYIKWSSQLFLVMAIVCQLPILSYLVFQLGFFYPKMLSQNRRIVFLFCLLVAALLSPPDLLAQWAITIFLLLFFETTVWLGMVFKQIAVSADSSELHFTKEGAKQDRK